VFGLWTIPTPSRSRTRRLKRARQSVLIGPGALASGTPRLFSFVTCCTQKKTLPSMEDCISAVILSTCRRRAFKKRHTRLELFFVRLYRCFTVENNCVVFLSLICPKCQRLCQFFILEQVEILLFMNTRGKLNSLVKYALMCGYRHPKTARLDAVRLRGKHVPHLAARDQVSTLL